MLQNYFKIAIRNIVKKRGYTLLNVAGLAIGMTCCLLLLQYVNHEFSYDRFHEKADRIYRIQLNSYQDGKLAYQSATSYPAAVPAIRQDFPEVVNGCRLYEATANFVERNSNNFFVEQDGFFADLAFLEMFDIEFIKGNPATALQNINSIIISESFAKKYFGADDPLGKTLLMRRYGGVQRLCEVAGVFKDYPENSHLDIDYLLSINTLIDIERQNNPDNPEPLNDWGWYSFYSFLELAPGVKPETLEAKLPGLFEKYDPDWIIPGVRWNEFELQPLRDIYLYSNLLEEVGTNGNGRAVAFLLLIAFAILGIAWINYINLATSRAVERAKEVGLRKTLGAARAQLIGQFMIESFLLNGIAFLLAFGASTTLLPKLEQFIGKEIDFILYQQPLFWAGVGTVFTLGTIIAGLYPAFVLSSFKPITAMRNIATANSSGQWLRKALVITQFAASIILIAGTMIIMQQLAYMRNQDLGVNIDQNLIIKGPLGLTDSLHDARFNYLKENWLQIPGVQKVAASSTVPGNEITWTNSIHWTNNGNLISLTHYHLGINYEFMDAYDIEIIAGRNFSRKFGTDDRAVLLNETSVRQFGMNSPEAAIGQRIVRGRIDTLEVVGVVKDFHQEGLQKAHSPMLFLLRPNISGHYSLKVQSPDLPKLIAQAEEYWQAAFPETPFEYFFLDEYFDRQYKADIQFGKVFGGFSALAILIACMGLFGLASYNVLHRTKEIGIRKVLGASVTNIVGLLSKDFLKLVAIAVIIAIPVTWWIMNNWLQNFAYRISIGWHVFALAGMVALAVALLTVASQAFKAATANPVRSIRAE